MDTQMRIRVFQRPDHTKPRLSGGTREFLAGLVLGVILRQPDGYYHVDPAEIYAHMLSRAPQHAHNLMVACEGWPDLAIPHQVCRKLSDEVAMRLPSLEPLAIARAVSVG